MRDEVSVIALRIFDQPEDRADENKHASSVKCVQLALPRDGLRKGSGRGHSTHSQVKDDTCDDETAEEQQLHYKTADDDLLTGVYSADCTASHDATTCFTCQ